MKANYEITVQLDTTCKSREIRLEGNGTVEDACQQLADWLMDDGNSVGAGQIATAELDIDGEHIWLNVEDGMHGLRYYAEAYPEN